jgi:maleylpyruvate isomerase
LVLFFRKELLSSFFHMILHGYWRSTAAWRVRIALAIKGINAAQHAWKLPQAAHRGEAYLHINPQGLVPALVTDDGTVLTQSLAICEWLDEYQPDPPLLPRDMRMRAQARAFAMTIACDIHPLQNLRVLTRLRDAGLAEDAVSGWIAWVIGHGLSACEALLAGGTGRFCFGDEPGLADLCLIPQLYNARRFGVAPAAWPRLLEVEAASVVLPPFQQADPSRQPDTP